jgi:hypothetical protein
MLRAARPATTTPGRSRDRRFRAGVPGLPARLPSSWLIEVMLVAPSPRHMHMVEASKDEAQLAVRLYNDPTEPRSFEGFVVHIHLAWLYLLHAEFERDGVDYRCWRKVGRARRLDKVDGEPKRWDLSKSVRERWIDAKQPVRANLDFFISLRNKIEHRYARQQQALGAVVGGQAQALLLNYEEELTTKFGSCVSLATRLRFPVFIGSFTSEGEQTLRRLRKSLPTTLRTFIAEYEAGLDDRVTNDPRYELRLRVLQELAPKDPDALAVQYTRYDDLTEEQRETVEAIGRKGHVIVRERKRDVVGHGLKKPKQVVAEVAASIPFDFTMGHFTKAWRLHKIRQPAGVEHAERTLEQYCLYDERHEDYGYKQAYINKLIRECSTEAGFREYLKVAPKDKVTGKWVGEPPLSATPPWKRRPPDDEQ